MFEIIGDEKELYQWDTNRFLTVPNGIEKVRFSNLDHGVSVDVEAVGDTVEIPPELLQIYGNLYVWGCYDGNTSVVARFDVIKAPRPADYVYTPTEIKTWKQLEERIAILEKGGASEEEIIKIVEDYLTENPPELDEEAVAEIVTQQTADFARIHPEKTAPKETTGQFVYDIESGTIMCDGNIVYIGFPFKVTGGAVPFAALPTDERVSAVINNALNGKQDAFKRGAGLAYDDGEMWVDDEYVMGLVMPAVNGKQNAFEIGDGLKLVDGVLSLNLDTWQGGEY